MPRPKRTKLAPSVPIIPAAIASWKPQTRPDGSPAVSSSRGTNGSDDSEGVVTQSKTGVNRRGIAPQPVFMSGALAVEDVGPQRPRPVSSGKRVELSRIAREGDYAKSHEALKKRGDANVASERLTRAAEDAERQMQSTQTAKAPNQKIAPIQIAKTQATPLKENSVLALENFKRRPRQPSILQIAQAHNAAAESENDDTLDDFNPDDESTPFRDSRSIPQQELFSTSSRQSLPRKRKLSTPEIQVPASQIQSPPIPSSSPPPSQPDDLFDLIAEDSQPNPPLPKIPTRTSPQPKPIDSDTMAPPQSSSLPPSPQKLQPNRQPKLRNKKAPVASKSKPSTTNSALHDQSHPILPPRSPSPTLSSPTTAPQARSPLKPLTTSALQNLLPRRRRRLASSTNKENTVFDLNTSSEIDSFNADEDEDELNYQSTTRVARKSRNEKPKKSASKVKGGKKGKSVASTTGTRKLGQGATANKGAAQQRQSMTYTRKPQNTSEAADENELVESGDDDESGEDEWRSGGMGALMDGKARQEMKKLAAKFREVDDWGLEFEEVTGSSDRMRDAR
ncbi:MAG: hypothetical protein L6R38_004167 [Xanthoria sp. 2 TBL-2021]|nr:MAG: hypothetical protein L6R38_004167 [Xanthoria sp. 2 TBL-2021]